MFGLHYRLERKAIGLMLAIIGVASIGGIVEIVPLFTIHQTVEDQPALIPSSGKEFSAYRIQVRGIQ